jgi:hypothetical protein
MVDETLDTGTRSRHQARVVLTTHAQAAVVAQQAGSTGEFAATTHRAHDIGTHQGAVGKQVHHHFSQQAR